MNRNNVVETDTRAISSLTLKKNGTFLLEVILTFILVICDFLYVLKHILRKLTKSMLVLYLLNLPEIPAFYVQIAGYV